MWQDIGTVLHLMRRRRGLGVGYVLVGLCATGPAIADDRHLSLEFEAYVGGISALSIGIEAGLRPDAYAVDFRFGTRGIVSWVVDWSMTSYSRGVFDDGRLVPAKAGADSLWNGRKRSIRLDYGQDGRVSVDLVPPPRGEDREPVPDPLRIGTSDLSSALLATLDAVGRDGKCERRAKIYDGRRRYDLVFEDGGSGAIGPNAPSVYHGPTIRCRLSIDPVAGFMRTSSRVDWATGDEAVVHVARVFDGAPPIPVAVEYDTGMGLLRAYVREATFWNGGRQQRLAAARTDERPESGGDNRPGQAP